jgi:probable F420-dependent oxidoreductase
MYAHTLDPLVALTAAAAATERLRLGTGICLVTERDPIVTAKAVATLDQLSGGRVLFGVGAGWNEEELQSHGTNPRRRFGVMRERVEAMKAIWTQDEASYHGEHVSFEPLWSWPKPAQKPHPPVLVGGNGRKVLDRVLAYGDEWFPNGFRDEERFIDRLGQLRRRAQDADRDPIPVTLQLAPTDPAALERLEQAGVTRCVWYLPSGGADEVGRAL